MKELSFPVWRSTKELWNTARQIKELIKEGECCIDYASCPEYKKTFIAIPTPPFVNQGRVLGAILTSPTALNALPAAQALQLSTKATLLFALKKRGHSLMREMPRDIVKLLTHYLPSNLPSLHFSKEQLIEKACSIHLKNAFIFASACDQGIEADDKTHQYLDVDEITKSNPDQDITKLSLEWKATWEAYKPDFDKNIKDAVERLQ